MNKLDILKLLASLGGNLPRVITLAQRAYGNQLLVIADVREIASLVAPAGSMPPQAFGDESPLAIMASFDATEQIAIDDVIEVYNQHSGFGAGEGDAVFARLDGSRLAALVKFISENQELIKQIMSILGIVLAL